MGKDSKMSKDPPKHEMKYFKGLTSEVRAFGQFRKVMHTGLYSQLVSMEIRKYRAKTNLAIGGLTSVPSNAG